jgi:hypothetical protein
MGQSPFPRHRKGRYITWVMASELMDDSVELAVKDHPGSIVAAARRLAQTLNTGFLRLAHSIVAWEAERMGRK